jgi:hypothetical protein
LKISDSRSSSSSSHPAGVARTDDWRGVAFIAFDAMGCFGKTAALYVGTRIRREALRTLEDLNASSERINHLHTNHIALTDRSFLF